MQKALIRSDAEREARKQLVAQNREKRVPNPQPKKSTDLVMRDELPLRKRFLVHFQIRPSNLLVLSNTQSRFASVADQTLLTNIFGAYERTCMATKPAVSTSFPPSKQSSIHTFLNQYTERQTSLVKFFKLVPEFERLSMSDKIRLIRNGFCLTLPINEATLSVGLSPQLLGSMPLIFDASVSGPLIRSIQLVHSYSTDRSLLKILLIINNLSTGIYRYRHDAAMDSIYDDTLAIFAAQNIYVELLWRYLLRRFPTEKDVVKFYNKLIQDFIFLQTVSFMADSHINNLAYEIEQMDPLIQSMWPAPIKPNDGTTDDCDMTSSPSSM